jgi:hypothetical protein
VIGGQKRLQENDQLLNAHTQHLRLLQPCGLLHLRRNHIDHCKRASDKHYLIRNANQRNKLEWVMPSDFGKAEKPHAKKETCRAQNVEVKTFLVVWDVVQTV